MPCKGDVKKTYFANSGAECDENAIKIAKAFTKRSGVILLHSCFPWKNKPDHGTDSKESICSGYGTVPGRNLPCTISICIPCTKRIHRG